MKIGIVAYWFNRGQATVARYLRDAFATLGHQTWVLARPTKDQFHLPRKVDRTDVWDQERVQPASRYEIPQQEYLEWADRNELDLIWFDQNYQFLEIAALRRAGHRTIGRFVWESFGQEHASGATAALDCIYALTDCELVRYRSMGVDSRRIPWGIHPELLYHKERESRPVRFFYPGGFLSLRKPTGEVYQAFRDFRRKNPACELMIKTQRPIRRLDLQVPRDWKQMRKWRVDKRQNKSDVDLDALAREGVVVIEDDISAAEYRELFSACDVCLAPSRWEGLGLHLWEALGYGLPVVCNDMPPLNEVIAHGENGLLTKSKEVARGPSGVAIMAPDVGSLSQALAQVADPMTLARLREGVIQSRERFRWDHTVRALESLIADYT